MPRYTNQLRPYRAQITAPDAGTPPIAPLPPNGPNGQDPRRRALVGGWNDGSGILEMPDADFIQVALTVEGLPGSNTEFEPLWWDESRQRWLQGGNGSKFSVSQPGTYLFEFRATGRPFILRVNSITGTGTVVGLDVASTRQRAS